MPKAVNPRHGSMQFWPRKRAKRAYARVRSWASFKDPQLLGFAGYKVGMSHVAFVDGKKTSLTKGTEIICPVTIVECPPIKALSLRFYQQSSTGLRVVSELYADKVDAHLKRKYAAKIKKGTESEFDQLRVVVYTQPSLTSIGKKKPDVFEMALGGSKEEQLKLGKELLNKDITITDVFKKGQFVDVHAVTKGKGFQGAVKRFGIGLTSHKSEKSRRTPGSLGPWKGQTHILYRVAHAGQMGYHVRTLYNAWIVDITEKVDTINPKGGFTSYGKIQNPYLLIRGSVPGAAKRLLRFTMPMRPQRSAEAPDITHMHTP